MLNALTIDVEDYFQVNAFARVVRHDQWGGYPLRVIEIPVCSALKLLKENE